VWAGLRGTPDPYPLGWFPAPSSGGSMSEHSIEEPSDSNQRNCLAGHEHSLVRDWHFKRNQFALVKDRANDNVNDQEPKVCGGDQ
ncbi:MAG: hypothetical protein KJ000_13705, partial [Pirellulaceae bacterium]|nr:hypothetical protein [Pirellulaceae bacterium]